MKKEVNKKQIVFCGYNVFPYGFAQTQRLLLIARGLQLNHCEVTVLCRNGTYSIGQNNSEANGVFETIKYKYSSGYSYRPNSFVKRNFLKIKGVLNECLFLIKKRFSGELDYIFVTTNTFDKVLYYSILSKLLFTHSVIDNTEFWSAVKRQKWSFGEKLYDYLSPRLYNKVICISDFLYTHTLQIKNETNVLKIPAIVDFEKFEDSSSQLESNGKFILFCGSAVYYPIIQFIIEAFEMIDQSKVNLVIVSSNGKPSDFKKINSRINSSPKSQFIKLKSNLEYIALVQLYKESIALLIPLRNTKEDTARFPHKLGEYTASKSIIITTNNGEIPNYFTDMQNALIANKYDTKQFSEKIKYAISEDTKLLEMSENSYRTGLKNFDYRLNGKKIYNFLFNKL
jgi:glycosyltransferase involved in cell wall biosynthesis